MLKIENYTAGYANSDYLFQEISLEILPAQVVGIKGTNGCGKSTLLKILASFIRPDSGSVYFGHNVIMGYYDQTLANLDSENTLLDELWSVDDDAPQTKIRTILGQFNFSGEDALKTISTLSGGERARLTLAKLMLKASNTLLLDEPTNHLDIATIDALETALNNYNGTVLAVSHDRYFVDKLATKIIDFNHITDGSPLVFQGNYKEYSAFLAERENLVFANTDNNDIIKVNSPLVSGNKLRYEEQKKQASEKRKLQTKLARLNEEKTILESELDKIAEGEKEFETDHIVLAELFEKKIAAEARLLEIYEELERIT